MPSSLYAIGWRGLSSSARLKLASALSKSPVRPYAMPRSMYGAVAVGTLCTTFSSDAIPCSYCFCSSWRTALSYCARVSAAICTLSVSVKPVSLTSGPATSTLLATGAFFATGVAVEHATSASDPMAARTARQVVCSPAALSSASIGSSFFDDRVGSDRIDRRLAVFVSIDRSEEAGADLRLRVTTRLENGESRETLVGPRTVIGAGHQLEILLVELDGLLLEWERLFLELIVVLLERRFLESCRPLGLEQRAAKVRVDLGHVVGRGRGDLSDLVVHELAEPFQCQGHPALFFFQGLLERLPQFHRDKAVEERLGENQRRARGQVARPPCSLARGGCIDANDLRELFSIERVVAAALVDFRDFEARFHRRLDRLRELRQVA